MLDAKKSYRRFIIQEVEEKATAVAAPKHFSKRLSLIHPHEDPAHLIGNKYYWDAILFQDLLKYEF